MEIVRSLKAERDAFIHRMVPLGATGELKRAADRFALIAGAGELATGWVLTGWQPGEAMAAAERCFREWVKERGTTGPSDLEGAIRHIRAFLELNGASRFQPLPVARINSKPIANRAGFTRSTSNGGTEYIILREVFRTELCKGYNYEAVLRELDKRQFLVRERPNMTIKSRLPELGSIRAYCISSAIMEGQ
jgi:uncharacterized protein (DUF927 family)